MRSRNRAEYRRHKMLGDRKEHSGQMRGNGAVHDDVRAHNLPQQHVPVRAKLPLRERCTEVFPQQRYLRVYCCESFIGDHIESLLPQCGNCR